MFAKGISNVAYTGMQTNMFFMLVDYHTHFSCLYNNVGTRTIKLRNTYNTVGNYVHIEYIDDSRHLKLEPKM